MESTDASNCEELLKVLGIMEQGLRASVADISEDHLNHQFAEHKMTIGQLAVHTMSWPRYFLSATPPWEETPFTCRPCSYPISLSFVEEVISDGTSAMKEHLTNTNDHLLEVDAHGEKGKGYIIYRLLLHILVHANQIAYLRSILDPSWQYGNAFGDMATALISMDYHTSKDMKHDVL